MAVITLDFETYYDNEFSLRHMTYEQYVRDPRFEAIMCSIHIPSEKELYWVKGDEIGKELQRLELHKHVQIAHNNAFDAFILNDHFGISAAGYGCTLQMARVAKNAEGSMSLDNLSKENNLKPKGTFVQNMLGVRARDMSESQWRDYGDYCLTDSENCTSLYKIYRPYFSTQDLNLISETLRWGAECKFVLNEQLLEDYVERLKVRRETRLELLADAYNVDTTKLRSMLRSSKTFAQMLRDQGVEPPTKINDKGNETYAFAKTDLEFKELADHPNQRVVDLYETKVGTQSSIAETRAATFLQIAKRGKMPFPLVPFKAVTGRHGATQKLNTQNLPARGEDTYLRQSMGAPKDHAVVTNDLAQVEARRLAALAGELRLVEQFYRGDDVYSLFGTTMFKYEVSKATPRERAIAKECLAEGALILTDVGLIPIEKIKLTHRLWDGVSWVKHDGLIYQGVREVITYDGITATTDHEVFCVDGRIRTLGQAQQCGVALVSTGLGEQAIPFSDRGFTACSDRQRLSLYTSQVHDNKAIKVGVLRHSDVGSKQEFYTQRTGGSPLLQAGEPSMDGDARSVQQPTKPCVSQVRWAWDKVSSRARRIVSMGIKNLRGKELQFFSANRDRPCGQQRALRAIQSSFFHTFTKFAEPIKHFVCFVWRCGYTSSGVGVPLCSDTYIQSNQTWYDGRADSRGCSMFNTQPLQGLETVTKKVAVYDIANAGAAKRFTANGKLVLNCILSSGFGAGWRSFQTRMKGAYGVSMTDEEAQYYIRHYREVHTRITNFWEQCTTAIRTMYKGGEYKFGDNDELTAVKGEIIFADGWRLRYDDIKFEGYDQYGREQYSYYSHRHRSRKHLYSGLVANNVTQGTAARILHWHLFELRKRGKIMSGAVHDELISVVHYKEVFDYYEAMTSVMRTTPEWAKNTPLDCEFELGLNYGTLTDIKTFTQQHYDDLRKYHPTDLLDRYAA